MYTKREGVIFIKQRTLNQTVTLIFATVAVLHLLRLLMGWEVSLAGWSIPIWASFIGVGVACFLAYQAAKLTK